MLTVDQVSRALPATLKKAATQSLVDKLNHIATDPVMAEQIRDNFLSYTKVLQEGRFKTEDYLNAVMYVSYKLMGMTNQDAYFRTFPQRHQNLLAQGSDDRQISAYVSMYNKGKLVNLILEQSLVPSWVLNQDAYQKAINTQVEIMGNEDASFVARTAAANSILTHLAKPKEIGPLINIDMRENSGINELQDMMVKLAKQQRELIQSGVPTRQIADQILVEAEVVE